MNVNLTNPIAINVNMAKLIVEDNGQSAIEFTLLGQPVRLYISSTDYSYITDINIGDRVKLIENFAGLGINSNGIVSEIIPDVSDDQILVLFDQVFPDEILEPVQVNIISSKLTIKTQVPMRLVQKL